MSDLFSMLRIAIIVELIKWLLLKSYYPSHCRNYLARKLNALYDTLVILYVDASKNHEVPFIVFIFRIHF